MAHQIPPARIAQEGYGGRFFIAYFVAGAQKRAQKYPLLIEGAH